MATYSRSNGWLAAALAAMCLLVALFDGASGRVALAGLFGFVGLLLGLQAMDELVWEGSQDGVVRPMKRIVGALIAGFAAFALLDLLVL
jgi:hypothetical protein